jgi:glycosyltransferase involved in cell wall biosynthesis
MPHVSVITPLFNDAHSLSRAVQSALKQPFLGEIIIVDDASTDNSLARAHDLAHSSPLIKVIAAPVNRGPAAARNLGACRAQFDYLNFLDSDDELLEGFFGEIMPLLENHKELHAAKVGVQFLDPIKGNVLPDFDPRYPAVIFSYPCNIVIRRESFLKMGGFSEDSAFKTKLGGEDAAFCSALAKHLAPLAKIDTAYCRCWSRGGSHLDNFLSSTRLADNEDGFEFVNLSQDQLPGGRLARAIDAYLNQVATNLGLTASSD